MAQDFPEPAQPETICMRAGTLPNLRKISFAASFIESKPLLEGRGTVTRGDIRESRQVFQDIDFGGGGALSFRVVAFNPSRGCRSRCAKNYPRRQIGCFIDEVIEFVFESHL